MIATLLVYVLNFLLASSPMAITSMPRGMTFVLPEREHVHHRYMELTTLKIDKKHKV